MKYVISFSGGIGSAATVLLAHNLKLDYVCVFADTLIEDEDLYRFCNDVSKYINKPIIRLVDGRNPWEVYVSERYIGNTRTAHCSQRLKTDKVRTWITSKYSSDKLPTLVLGMPVEEKERIDRARRKWEPIPVTSLLIDYGIDSRCDIENIIVKSGIQLPRLYSYGFTHNNCGGFCCRAGLTQFATLLKHFPDRFNWHVEQEEKAYAAIGPTARPFLRHSVNGVQRYIRLSEFKEMIESGKITVPLYDFGGCACFVDEVDHEVV